MQLKALFTDKYYILLILYFLIYTIGTTFKNIGLVYYCNYVLGTYNDGLTQMLISVIGGLPMGIGIFLVWPLARKFGKKNVTMIGFVIYAIGSLICWIFPSNLVLVLVGQFIKNIGGLPCAYVFMALFADSLDHLEWKTGFRSDGSAMSVYNIIAVAMVGICTGLFNLFLSQTGYVAPVTLQEYTTNITQYAGYQTQLSAQEILQLTDSTSSIAFIQNAGVNNFISFSFVGLEVITGVICALILFFINVEKTIIYKQLAIVERKKAKILAQGKAWLSKEESDALELAEQEKEAEEVYKEELKQKCATKGLNYEKELEKHNLAVSQKKEEKTKKEALAKAKEEAKIAKTKAKEEAKLAKLTEEQKAALEAKNARRQEKIDKLWAKEKVEGEDSYQKYSNLLDGDGNEC